jgi:hypothetical protein
MLHLAIERENESIIRLLIENGADANPATKYLGDSVLHKVIQGGNGSIIRLLIENGADVNPAANSFGYSVLRTALLGRNKSIIRLLIESGADINAADRRGASVLHTAIQSSSESIVHLFVDLGAEITSHTINLAVRYGLESIASFLYETMECRKSTASGVSEHIPALELDLKHQLDLSDVEDSSEQDTPKPQRRMRLRSGKLTG